MASIYGIAVLLLIVSGVQSLTMVNRRQDCGTSCGPDSCCVMVWLPGRRRFFVNGICQKLRKEGDTCHPDDTRHSCPCAEEFRCDVLEGLGGGRCVKK